MYTYIYICYFTYIYTTYINLGICVYICTHIYVHIYIHVYMCICSVPSIIANMDSTGEASEHAAD